MKQTTHADDVRNTAYAYNTRAIANVPRPRITEGWHPRIRELYDRDYAFIGYRYSDSGMLFRGIRCGLAEYLRADRWLISKDEGPLGALERELGVFLVSHDLSDALTVARLWETVGDAAVLVFPVDAFNTQWTQGNAAVLGFAEPGVVFKYPFMVEAPSMPAMSTIIAPSDCRIANDSRIRRPDATVGQNRSAVEQWALTTLERSSHHPATPIATERYPRLDRDAAR